jgi:hypothetical protein
LNIQIFLPADGRMLLSTAPWIARLWTVDVT